MTDKKADTGTTPYAVGERVEAEIDVDVEVGASDVKSTPTPAVNPIIFSGPKQGHMFCGCCCDVRRATIAVNIASIIFAVISMITVSITVGNAKQNETNDPYAYTYNDQLNTVLTVSIIASIIGICFSIAAIIGAIKFNICLVGSNVVWLVIGFIITIAVSVSATGYSYGAVNILYYLAIVCFFIYPHVMLMYEIKGSKTMSQETYTPREEKSCCCVSPGLRM